MQKNDEASANVEFPSNAIWLFGKPLSIRFQHRSWHYAHSRSCQWPCRCFEPIGWKWRSANHFLPMTATNWHSANYGISKPSLGKPRLFPPDVQILWKLPSWLRIFHHFVAASAIPSFFPLLDNITFNQGIFWRYYPSIVNSFALGCVWPMTKMDQLLTTTSGKTIQLSSNEKKKDNLKGPIRIRWKGRFDLRCERLFWKPSTVDACLVFGLDVYIYICICILICVILFACYTYLYEI